MIVMKSSSDHAWPWASEPDETAAETSFQNAFPSLHAHFKPFEERLRKRQDHGRYWWELRPCAYYDKFDKERLVFTEITWAPQFAFDVNCSALVNTAYFISSVEPWLISVLNSPVIWWFSWRSALHGKDEALRFIANYVEALPVPDTRSELENINVDRVSRVVAASTSLQGTRTAILDWIRMEHGAEKPGRALQNPVALSPDSFVTEVKRALGAGAHLSAAQLKSLRDEHAATIVPAQALRGEVMQLEREINDLVNQAYGLSEEEIALMWRTAPPRMPLPAPPGLETPDGSDESE
jgi:hypothetical protein